MGPDSPYTVPVQSGLEHKRRYTPAIPFWFHEYVTDSPRRTVDADFDTDVILYDKYTTLPYLMVACMVWYGIIHHTCASVVPTNVANTTMMAITKNDRMLYYSRHQQQQCCLYTNTTQHQSPRVVALAQLVWQHH